MNSQYQQVYQWNKSLIKVLILLREGWGKIAAGAMMGHLVFAILIPLERIIFRVFVGVGTESLGCWLMIAMGGLIGAGIITPEVWNESQVALAQIDESI